MNRKAVAAELVSVAKLLTAIGKKKWHKVPGSYPVDVADLKPDVKALVVKELPAGAEAGDWELVVEFESTGYYDPGQRGGRVEDSYPPEGEDEREVTDMTVYNRESGSKEHVEIKGSAREHIFNKLYDRVMEVELSGVEDVD
jgi:hypothetical protein